MEWAQFGLDVFRAAVWPVLLVGLLWWLGRDAVLDFMRRLRKGSALGLSVELQERAADAADEAELILEAADPVAVATASDLVFAEPVPVIIDEWRQLEAALNAFTAKNGGIRLETKGVTTNGDARFDRLARTIFELQQIRYRVAHGAEGEITPITAEEYRRAARNVRAALESML